MNAKTLVPLIIALVLGVVAAKIGRDMIVRRQAEQARVKMVRVVLAAADLPPGTVLEEEHLAPGAVPEESSAPGLSLHTFANPADVVGRVVAAQLVRGQPVLDTLLAPKGAGAGAQAMIPEGMRALTVEVNEYNGVAGLLVPGCSVDVVHTLKLREGGHDGEMMSRTLVENLRVLAVGRRTSAAPQGAAKSPDPEQQQPRSVTLLVTQAQAELIDLVTRTGQPRLVLRNALDKQVTGGKGVTLAELRGGAGGAGAAGGDPRTGPHPLTGIFTRLLPSLPPATRPSTPDPAKIEPGKIEPGRIDPIAHKTSPRHPNAAPSWRDVEVIRAGSRSTVRVNSPETPALSGLGDQMDGQMDD